MKARFLGVMTGAVALLIGAVLPPAAHAQSVNCDTVMADLSLTSQSELRDALLSDYIAEDVPANTNEEVYQATYQMVCRAVNWQTDGLARGGDLNPKYNSSGELQPEINAEDAAIMFFVLSFIDNIGSAYDAGSENGGDGAENRDNFLSDLRGTDTTGSYSGTDNDDAWLEMVRKTVNLLCETDPSENFTHPLCS